MAVELFSIQTLRVVCVGLFALAWILLVVAQFEERVFGGYKDESVIFASRLFVWMCRVATLGLAFCTYTYLDRSTAGWKGLSDAQVTISLMGYIVVWLGALIPAFVLLSLIVLFGATTTPEERERRELVRRRRMELERRVAQRD